MQRVSSNASHTAVDRLDPLRNTSMIVSAYRHWIGLIVVAQIGKEEFLSLVQ
jgi:hypothetical protein